MIFEIRVSCRGRYGSNEGAILAVICVAIQCCKSFTPPPDDEMQPSHSSNEQLFRGFEKATMNCGGNLDDETKSRHIEYHIFTVSSRGFRLCARSLRFSVSSFRRPSPPGSC